MIKEKYYEKRKFFLRRIAEKKGLERHKLSKKLVPEEYEKLKTFLEEIKRKSSLQEESPETDIKKKADLDFFITELDKEISKMATPEEIEETKEESTKRLFRFMREREETNKKIKEIEEELRKFEEKLTEQPFDYSMGIASKFRKEVIETIEEMKKYLEEKLPFQNPESFLAHALLKLREYRDQLPSGLVETPYVERTKRKIKDILFKQKLVALVGETGTGKTVLAREIAKEISREYEFVPGHRFTSKEDLFAYLGIEAKKILAEEIPFQIKTAIEKFEEQHPELPEETKREFKEIIKSVIVEQAATPEMISKVFQSSVLKAAQEGKIVIIDEFNYIAPALLGGLNALIEAKPGQKISIFGQEVEVKPGFGVIFTGNITKSDFQGRYLQREKLDPALVNRLNSGLIEYSSLPQENDLSFEESIISFEDFQKGKKPPERELFQVALTILADKKGNISGPPDLLTKCWSLCREISLFQKIYAGEQISSKVKLPNGQSIILKEYAVSNRTFRSIIEGWQKDGFSLPLEWYIYDHLLRPASIIAPSEAGQMLILLKERAGFFQEEEWNILNIDPTTQKIKGMEEIREKEEEIKEKLKQRIKKEIKYFLPKEVAEAMRGVRCPPLKTEEFKKVEADKEKIERFMELKSSYERLEKLEKAIEGTIDAFCQDEKMMRKDKPWDLEFAD